jgi:hypothetical protein
VLINNSEHHRDPRSAGAQIGKRTRELDRHIWLKRCAGSATIALISLLLLAKSAFGPGQHRGWGAISASSTLNAVVTTSRPEPAVH